MKERPIIFTPENAQKVHEGVKTQTRRIVKRNAAGRVKAVGSPKNWHLDDPNAVLACPYGQPGTRLWIREALYRKSDVMTYVNGAEVTQDDLVLPSFGEKKTIPSIHMPRWACRTVVELTDVLVERVQDITEDNAKAEGAAFVCEQCGSDLDTQEGSEVHAACDDLDCNQGSYREGFRRLWNSINGTGSWERNDWVWVLTFKRVSEVGK